MKNLSITLLLLILSMTSKASETTSLDAQTQKKVIERVKEYCGLMQEISGDVENIDKMETMYSLCENNNVSVFNDLTVSRSKDISDNSMPLQQYMMMLTDKFENKVKTSFSGYKYVKLVIQPSPLKEQDAARYAFVKVDKQVKAQGINSKQKLNIIVNTATMKVSSTISEDYEDPQKIYLEALEKFNDGNYKAAIPLFTKISDLSRYPGRYRAKTMLGWIYTEQKKYQEAHKLLRVSSEEDPLGGVILASKILLADDVPAKFINYTEAGQILQKLSDARDKEIPTMHLIAKSAIVDAFDLQTLRFKFMAFDNKMADELITDPHSTDAFKIRGLFVKAFNAASSNDIKQMHLGLNDIKKASESINTAGFDKKTYEHWDCQLSAVEHWLLAKLGNREESKKLILAMQQKPYCTGYLGASLITTENHQEALNMLKRAAEHGDAFASYVVSISYFPTHNPLIDYEKDFISETKMSKDEVALPNWKKFVAFLISDKSQKNKSYDEFLKWNKKAMELGDINAKEDYAFFEASGVLPNLKIDIPHALEVACSAASIGLRSKSSKLYYIANFAYNYDTKVLKKSFEESQTAQTLKALDAQGNGAASYMLYYFTTDTIQATKYLKRSVDANFFHGLHAYGDALLENGQYEQAEKIYGKMAIYPYSYIMSKLGDIQKDYRHDYKLAKYCYETGKNSQQDPICSERLGDLYKDGLGVKKNLNLAKAYYIIAIKYYKALECEEDDEAIINIRSKLKEMEGLKVNHTYSNTVKEMINRLNDVLDAAVSEEERINRSQSLLSEIFASPQAKVKTMDVTGNTIVSTETAEDFMLRLVTIKTNKKLVGMRYKKTKEEKFKLTELTVRMK